jgi:asparagine synthase (glutamine-hydrolysing)
MAQQIPAHEEVDLPRPAGSAGPARPPFRFLSDGQKPIRAEGSSVQVVFDGWLHDRSSLGDGVAAGPSVAMNDAELVLHAYCRWGEDALKRMRGTFAVVIRDEASGRLLCARDPLGVYPLFYSSAGGELLFSTSVEPLVRHPGVSATVNRAVLADDLAHRWPDREETFFTGVKRVPPGHAMRVDRDGRRLFRYWHPGGSDGEVAWIGDAEVEQFDDRLDQAVARCLEPGPAAIYLSGGLDSVSVAAVAADQCRRTGSALPSALSLIFPHPECNEEPVQTGVAAQLGVPQVTLSIDEAAGPRGLLAAALEMTARWPAPLQNFWAPAYQQLAREGRRRGCRVILTGGGGDEWLTVTPFYAADLLRTGDVGELARFWTATGRSFRCSRAALMRGLLWTFGLRPLLGRSARRMLGRVAPQMLGSYRVRQAERLLPSWLAPDPSLRQEMRRRWERSLDESETKSFYLREIRRALDHPLVAREREETFEEGGRTGVRILQPFLDAELVDLLLRTPPRLLNRDGRSKGLVRQMLARRFPGLGFERQKKVTSIGFFRNTIMKEAPGAWRMMGGTPALADLGVVDPKAVRSFQGVLAQRDPRDAQRVWAVLNLEAWVRPRM